MTYTIRKTSRGTRPCPGIQDLSACVCQPCSLKGPPTEDLSWCPHTLPSVSPRCPELTSIPTHDMTATTITYPLEASTPRRTLGILSLFCSHQVTLFAGLTDKKWRLTTCLNLHSRHWATQVFAYCKPCVLSTVLSHLFPGSGQASVDAA